MCSYSSTFQFDFIFFLAGPDQRKSKLAYGTTSDVALKINETDLSLLSASIESPSGHKEDCLLKRLPNGHVGRLLFCASMVKLAL